MPSRRGRPRSSTTRSGANCSAAVSASAPSPALRTSWPSARSERRRTSAIASSSSTTRTRAVAVACSITPTKGRGHTHASQATLRKALGRAFVPGRAAAPGVEWVGGCLQTAFSGLRSGAIRPGARSSLRAGDSESRRRVGARVARAADLARGDAAPPRPGRLELHRAGGLPRLRPLPRLERGNGRRRLGDGPRLRGGSGGDRRPGRPRARRDRPDPAPASCPRPDPWRSGVVAIACGLLLALAAQTAGLGPDGVRKGLFDPDFFPHHGGGVGETLYWATTTLFQRLGAHIIAVVLVVSGLLLISGRSVSDMVRAARRGADRARRGTRRFRDGRQGEPDPHRPRPDRHLARVDRAGLRPARAGRGRGRRLPGARAGGG